jgi:uncharacterized protein YbjT (DUF2867 family)
MNISAVLILGGTGFIGRHLVDQLLQENPEISIVLPTRNFKNTASLTQKHSIKVITADIHQPGILEQLLNRLIDIAPPAHCAVINLVGVLHSKHGIPYGADFAKAHVELPKKIIAACQKLNISRLIHMSALGADSTGPSMYQRSKGDGEKLILNSPLNWTVFRPSVVFGKDDRFINLFAQMQKFTPIVPLAGAKARFQPIWVNNVAQGFIEALKNSQTIHKAFDLGGPKIYTLAELVQFAGKISGHSRFVFPLPHFLAYLQAFLLEYIPGGPLMSRDNLYSMQIDNVLHKPIDKILNIIPKNLEDVSFNF